MNNELWSPENLTPRQFAYAKRLWRLYQARAFDRRYIIVASITGGLTLVFFILSIVSLIHEWATHTIWLLAFASGLFEAFFVMATASKRLWPAMGCIIDWKRLEMIVNDRGKN